MTERSPTPTKGSPKKAFSHDKFIFFCLFLPWLMAQGFPPATAETMVVPVKHRLPGEIVRAIQPVLEPDETIVAVPSGLLIKAKATRMPAIGELVAKLDRPLKNLIVTVLQSSQANLEQLNAGAGGKVYLPQGSGFGQGFWYHSQSNQSRSSQQSLQILEGHPAFIAVGQEQPVPVIQIYGYPPQVLGGIAYKSLTQGFQVLPRMVGCRVRLVISPWVQRLRGEGSISTQGASTTLEADLGQWIELGSDDTVENDQSKRFLGHNYTTGRGKRRIFVKVTAVDGC